VGVIGLRLRFVGAAVRPLFVGGKNRWSRPTSRQSTSNDGGAEPPGLASAKEHSGDEIGKRRQRETAMHSAATWEIAEPQRYQNVYGIMGTAQSRTLAGWRHAVLISALMPTRRLFRNKPPRHHARGCWSMAVIIRPEITVRRGTGHAIHAQGPFSSLLCPRRRGESCVAPPPPLPGR